MTRNECGYSRDISKAIDQCGKTCNALRKIVEDATVAKTKSIFAETLLIHQKTIIDLVELQHEHRGSCAICDP
jgi:hypothetical protein